MRRHPDTDLQPLRSAEPEPPTEEQDAQLHAPAEEYETPAWLADMTERIRAANEELADRRSMEVPRRGPRVAGPAGVAGQPGAAP